jgi:hypothetical protein
VPREPLPWTGEQEGLLRALRAVGDPTTDERVAALAVADVGELYRTLVTDISGDADPDRWIDRWFTSRPVWPTWVDPELLAVGQGFYRDRMWSLNVAFMLSSLPMSYCGRHGAEVLCRTGRMTEDTQRRIFETALLVTELAQPDGLRDGADGRPPGHGYLTVLRLRLLHAAARSALVDLGVDAREGHEPTRWVDPDAGVPVSQLDLLGTMWCFAISSLRALTLAGQEPTEREQQGWVHLWCLVGHLLGLDSSAAGDLLPMHREEAEQCFAAVRDLQFGESDDGKALAAELVQIGHLRIPFRKADHLVQALIQRNLGSTYAGMLGITEEADPKLIRRAEWFWHLTLTDARPREGLEPKRVGRWRVKQFLLRQVACQLMDRGADLRTPSATQDLMAYYRVGPLARRRAQRERGRINPPR